MNHVAPARFEGSGACLLILKQLPPAVCCTALGTAADVRGSKAASGGQSRDPGGAALPRGDVVGSSLLI